MNEERRVEMLWTMFVQENEERRAGGGASVGLDEVWAILDDAKHGRRRSQPHDLPNSCMESAFWNRYAKNYLRASMLKHDIRERFGGGTLLIESNNETSRALYQAALDLGAQRAPSLTPFTS